MAFWVTFLFYLGTQVLLALFAKPRSEDARPAGIDEFQVPTATEGRVVTIIVGKVRVSPNVYWYGDLNTRSITRRVGGFLGIGGTDQTLGYEYRLGVQMAMCRGLVDGHDRVWMGDKVVKSGEAAGNIVIDDLEFFGGVTDSNIGGGIQFTLEFQNGSDTQAVNAYLATQQNPTPAYRRTCQFILTDGAGGPGYVGNNARLNDLAMELFAYPNSLGVSGGRERIGEDANPICWLYEILVGNTDWGAEFQPGQIQTTGTIEDGNFIAVAEQVADEGLGFSMVVTREQPRNRIIREIERHVDGTFVFDLTDGKYKFLLARQTIATPVRLTEANFKITSFDRGTWLQTKTQIRVGFNDRAKEYDGTYARDYDSAVRKIRGRRAEGTLNYPGVKTAATANIIAARDMRDLSFPVAKANGVATRALFALRRGDPVLYNDPDEGIVDLPMRITRINYGEPRSSGIEISLVENLYRIETTGVLAPPPTAWIQPSTDPLAALDERLFEIPAQLAVGGARYVAALVARNGGLHTSYDIHTDFAGGGNFELSNTVNVFTPVASLQGALNADLNGPPHYTATITINSVVDVRIADLTAAASSEIDAENPTNLILIDDELLWFESATDNLNGTFDLFVNRGALDTIPADHLTDARVWFVGFGAGLLQPDPLPDGLGLITARITPRTATGTFELASAATISLTVSDRAQAPISPAGPIVNTELFVDGDWTTVPGVLRVSWNTRNRTTQPLNTKQDDASVAALGTVGARVRVRRVDTDAIVAETAFAALGQFTAAGYIPEASRGVPDELDFYIQLENIQSGRLSQTWETQNFEVFGYGIDYGSNYGGQDTGGLVEGVWLPQGAAPLVVDPVPTVPGQTRTLQIDVAGIQATQAQGANQGLRLLFSGFDGSAGVSFNYDFFVTYGTATLLEDIAAEIESESNTALAGRPFTVSRVGTRVEISSGFGDITLRVTNLQGSYQHIRALTDQAALGAQSPIQQIGFIDYFVAGASGDELAPASDPGYAAAGNVTVNFNVIGLTAAARARITNEGINGGNVNVSVPSNGSTTYNGEFGDIVTALNAHPNAAFFTASSGVAAGLTNPQGRSSLIISCDDDFDIQEQTVASNTTGQPSGFALIAKRGLEPQPDGPLAKVTRSFFLHNTAQNLNNVRLAAILDGTLFEAVVAGTTATDIRTAIAALQAAIDVSGVYDAELVLGSSLDEIRITTQATNIDFEAITTVGYGPRIEFRTITG